MPAAAHRRALQQIPELDRDLPDTSAPAVKWVDGPRLGEISKNPQKPLDCKEA